MRKLRILPRNSPFLLGCLVTLTAALLFFSFGEEKPRLLAALDHRLTDSMFHWRGPIEPTGDVVVVDIDEQSLRELGQWPWPRDLLARMVRTIDAAGPRVTGFDIVFAEPDRTSPARYLEEGGKMLASALPARLLETLRRDEAFDHDLALGAAVGEAPTVLGYVFQINCDGIEVTEERPLPSASLRLASAGREFSSLPLRSACQATLNVEAVAQAESEGFLNVFPDPSGTVRRVPVVMAQDAIPYPSLALEMARIGLMEPEIVLQSSSRPRQGKHDLLGVALGGRFIPTDGNGQVTVNFRGPSGTFRRLPAARVLRGEHRRALAGKYVLIGSSAAGLLDLRATPFSGVVPGVEVQANIVDNILAGDFFRHDALTEIGLTYALVIAGGVALSALLTWAGPLTGGAGALLFMAAILGGNFRFFFLRQQLVGVTYPLLTTLVVFMAVTLYNYFLKDREKRFIQEAFGQFVAPEVVRQLLRNPERLSLSGELKTLTVLFCDIRDFTGIAEGLDPERLGAFMNRYLTAMSEIIIENRGMVDKFIGDAIMAVWGAPLDDEAHAAHAVHAALCMVEQLERMQSDFRAQGLPKIRIGVGIHTGPMRLGNFGSERRFDYTVIGDAVNLASRLEALNKEYGTEVLITEQTLAAAGEDFFCRSIDRVCVKGRHEVVRIYEPLGEGESPAALREEIGRFERAQRLYGERRFTEAAGEFEALNRLRPRKLYRLYRERCEAFQLAPPPPDWDGARHFESK
jgi:adenylate cyclase